ALLRKVIHDEPAPPSRLVPQTDRELEGVAMKCLEKDPSARYATARELADELDRWLRGDPVRASRVTVVRRLLRSGARNRRPLFIGGALLVIAAVIAWRASDVWRASERVRIEQEQRLRRDAALRDLRGLWGTIVERQRALRASAA